VLIACCVYIYQKNSSLFISDSRNSEDRLQLYADPPDARKYPALNPILVWTSDYNALQLVVVDYDQFKIKPSGMS